MIVELEGKLTELEGGSAVVKVGEVGYEVFLPGYAISELSSMLGKDVRFFTIEYFEGSPGGGNIVPRMIGFLDRRERKFFNKYTSVKGMGVKKALKSLSMPISVIADAIERGDEKMLMSLPEIGKRFSNLIIAQLKGKLGDFAVEAGAGAAGGDGKSLEKYQQEALEILIAWGEKRAEAVELLRLAVERHPDIKSAEELVPAVYRIKQGVEA
jgi:Holliday junction DNA helicase RuvA